MRRAMAGETGEEPNGGEAEGEGEAEPNGDAALSPERYAQMSAAEQTILTVSENGFGKRTSSFEYRSTGRGGKGIVAMAVNPRNGSLVASFPVEEGDEIMLVTDGGQLIRVPVERHPRRRPRHPGRHRLRHRRTGARRLGRAHHRARRRRRRAERGGGLTAATSPDPSRCA